MQNNIYVKEITRAKKIKYIKEQRKARIVLKNIIKHGLKGIYFTFSYFPGNTEAGTLFFLGSGGDRRSVLLSNSAILCPGKLGVLSRGFLYIIFFLSFSAF